jgi:hypothetical protein
MNDGTIMSDEPTDKLNEPVEEPKEQTPLQPEEYGWSYYSYDEERGEAYKSVILNNKGDATEIWFVGENDGQLPNRFPADWNVSTLLYNDKTPINPNVMIEELNSTQEPNNWNIALDAIRREEKGKSFALGNYVSSHYSSTTPPYAPGEQQVSSTSPLYGPPGSPNYPPPGSPNYPPPGSPNYPPPGSPNYPPPGSPQYAPPGSPVYNPNSPGSPQYAPGSPVYNPNSPGSPQYAPDSASYNSNSSTSTIPPPPTSPPSSESNDSMSGGAQGINIDTSDTTELDKIEDMLNKTASKRDDGIELIINTKAEEVKENKDDNDKEEGDKKTIKLG